MNQANFNKDFKNLKPRRFIDKMLNTNMLLTT